MVDGFSSFNNKWLHRDIIAIVKVYCVGQLLDFTADTLLFNFTLQYDVIMTSKYVIVLIKSITYV